MGTSFSQRGAICSCDRAESPRKNELKKRFIHSDNISDQYINDAITASSSSSDNDEESVAQSTPNPPLTIDSNADIGGLSMDPKTMELLLSVSSNFTPTSTQRNDIDITYPEVIMPLTNKKGSKIIIEDLSPKNVMDNDDTDVDDHKEHITGNALPNEPYSSEYSSSIVRGGTERLREVSNVSDMLELHSTIKSLYGTDDDDGTESDGSVLDEEDAKEIERIKQQTPSSSPTKKHTHPFQKSRAFRINTTNPWEEEEIDETYNEMEQQLIAMKSNSIDISMESQQKSVPIYSPNLGDNDTGSGSRSRVMSHLIGSDLSTKNLDDSLMKQHKKEMKKQMVHLVQQSNASLNLEEIRDNVEDD